MLAFKVPVCQGMGYLLGIVETPEDVIVPHWFYSGNAQTPATTAWLYQPEVVFQNGCLIRSQALKPHLDKMTLRL
jgi:hypothetical protein